MSAAEVVVRRADLEDAEDRERVVALVDAYARDPMGGGNPLPAPVRARLGSDLAAHPTAFALLAFDGDRAAGVAVCVVGFSTFASRPVVNVHDLGVRPESRRRGVGRALLAAVEREARAMSACKVTLEVLERNDPARRLYEEVGFRGSAPGDGERTLFLVRPLEGAARSV